MDKDSFITVNVEQKMQNSQKLTVSPVSLEETTSKSETSTVLFVGNSLIVFRPYPPTLLLETLMHTVQWG